VDGLERPEGPTVSEYYQRITADGKNGPFVTEGFGILVRWTPFPGNPVVSESGHVYVEWGGNPSARRWISHMEDDIALARSSWPIPWGRNNTGRAAAAAVAPRLSIQRMGTGLRLRGSGLQETMVLESSSDLEHWTVVEQFSSGFAKDIPAEGRRYYRLR